MMDVSTVFFGTPEFAAVILRSLTAHTRVLAVVTRSDKPKGRGRVVLPSPVKMVAAEARLPVFQPLMASDPVFIQGLADLKPDLILTAAFGQILRPPILSIPRLGCVNVHASLLPAYRGAAPINWAIIRGERETGITFMQMDEGLDTGPILERHRMPILDEDTSETITRKLAEQAASILPEFLNRLLRGEVSAEAQDPSLATLAPPLKKEDGVIHWSESAESIRNRVRGLLPWPGAGSWLGDLHLKITNCRILSGNAEPGVISSVDKGSLVVGTGSDLLSITELQPAGKARMPVRAFLQGHRLKTGDRFHRGPQAP